MQEYLCGYTGFHLGRAGGGGAFAPLQILSVLLGIWKKQKNKNNNKKKKLIQAEVISQESESQTQ